MALVARLTGELHGNWDSLEEERMSEPVITPASVYALLADGRTVEIRPATHADYAAVKSMHEAMSPNNAYLRFFSPSRSQVVVAGLRRRLRLG